MNAIRVQIKLSGEEMTALARLARVERRDSREQAAAMVREMLELRGLLNPGDHRRGKVQSYAS